MSRDMGSWSPVVPVAASVAVAVAIGVGAACTGASNTSDKQGKPRGKPTATGGEHGCYGGSSHGALSDGHTESSAHNHPRLVVDGASPAAAERAVAVCADDSVWREVRTVASQVAAEEPALRVRLQSAIVNQPSLEHALVHILSRKFASDEMPAEVWEGALADVLVHPLPCDVVEAGVPLEDAMRADLVGVKSRDPAALNLLHVFIYFKGFQALQAHRVAHVLWHRGRKFLALSIQARVSEVFGMDLHPAAVIGKCVMFDHGTGVVVGETAVVGDGCSMLHGVTLGGTGKETGNRHPKLGKNVLVGAHASILGNICIGSRAKIGCGSVVLSAIPSGATAVGLPAKVIGRVRESDPSLENDTALHKVKMTRCDTFDFRGIWTQLDDSMEGYITPRQFHEKLAATTLSSAQIDDLFFRLDKDDNGVVTEKEFNNTVPTLLRTVCDKNTADGACQALQAVLSLRPRNSPVMEEAEGFVPFGSTAP